MIFSRTNKLLAVCLLLAGCAASVRGQSFKSENVFSSSPILPNEIKRVLVLPLAGVESRPDLSDSCENLDSVLQTELIKAERFEVVSLSPQSLRSYTGQMRWTGAEILPADFFDSLRRVYGCDAVLFCQLTEFRAYAPLAIGWRVKLVDARTQKIIWAADEVFDAGQPAVAKGAEQFQKQQQHIHGETTSLFKTLLRYADRQPQSALDDQWAILNSPRYFCRYSAAKLLQTLPER